MRVGVARQRIMDAALDEEVKRQHDIISKRKAAMRAAVSASLLMQRTFRG